MQRPVLHVLFLADHETMSRGVFCVGVLWFFLMLVPAVLPLLSGWKVLRRVTFGFGVGRGIEQGIPWHQ